MKKINSCLVLASIAAFTLIGCNQPPDVDTTPGSTTVVHDKTPSAPNVTVNTPPSTPPSTNSTTVTTPDGSSSSTTTKTTG